MIYQDPLAYMLALEGAALLDAWAGDHDRETGRFAGFLAKREHQVIGVECRIASPARVGAVEDARRGPGRAEGGERG